MTLFKKNLQLLLWFSFWVIVTWAFLLGRLSVKADVIPGEIVIEEDVVTATEEDVVTATEEAEAQLEFNEINKSQNKYDYTVWWEWLDDIVNYAYEQTKDLPHPNWWLMWLDLVKTWSLENARFSVSAEWTTDEKGICQLRYKYHKTFMDKQEFFDPYAQVDYCIEVYMDRYNRTRLNWQKIYQVRAARSIRDKASSRFKLL